MTNFNKVIVAGNLTRDPELRYLPSGSALCEAALAVNRKWKSKDGESKDEVSFFDLIAWGRTAEVIAEYFKKGRPILVEGRLQQERWEDKNSGAKRSRVRIVVESFQFIGGKREDSEQEVQAQEPSDDGVPF